MKAYQPNAAMWYTLLRVEAILTSTNDRNKLKTGKTYSSKCEFYCVTSGSEGSLKISVIQHELIRTFASSGGKATLADKRPTVSYEA